MVVKTRHTNGDEATADLQPIKRSSKLSKRKKLDKGIAKTVLGCTLTLWVVAVLVGVLLHVDLTREELRSIKRTLPLVWFDGILRHYGAFLPFPGLAIRWWGTALAKAKGAKTRSAAHFAEIFCVYVGLTAARFIVYGLHVTGILHWIGKPFIWGSALEDKKGQLMSDHLVLGASLTAMLSMEVVLTLLDLQRHMSRRSKDGFRLLCLFAALVVSGFLCIATTGDMFYTVRYFHGRLETFGAVLLGGLLFQGPLLYWLLNGL